MLPQSGFDLSRGSANGPQCDPSLFDDPIARRILWSPVIKKGASACCTHRAVLCHGDRLVFRRTLQWNLLVTALLVAGCALPIAGAAVAVRGGSLNTSITFILTGLLMGAVGIYFWNDSRQTRVFDRSKGIFQLPPRNPRSRVRALTEIHALQIVSRYVVMDDSEDFYCHELNVVLNNAARLNVIAHGSYRALRDDATTLSDFLNVPVWDQAVFD